MPALYARVAQKILPGWEISLAFVNARTARILNKKLRKKSYTPNVLVYQVGKKHGEILICKEVARAQAPSYQLSISHFQLLLFIHALLHLKGWAHSATMEKREATLLAQFTYGPQNSHRRRYRHLPG